MRFPLSKKTKRAAVLGCGPAGLFAAHGLIENGWDVTIYSKKRPSHLFGAQYLHAPIPGLTPDDADPTTIKYQLVGTTEEYRRKIYGNNAVETSVEVLGKEHQAWDIRTAYQAAWDRYADLVIDQEVTPGFLGIMKWTSDRGPIAPRTVLQSNRYELFINTIPLPSLCYQPDAHQFHSATVWAMGDAPARGQYVPYRPADNTVECNGSADTGWYRAAQVFGHATVEWPGNKKPPLPQVASVTKPLYTDCICYHDGMFPTKMIHLGRYGQWLKGVLSHTAYTTAVQL